MPTLYEPSRKPILPRRVLKGLAVAAVLVAVSTYLYRAQPGWLTRLATSVLEFFGREMVTLEVETNPVRADVLLDGERAESLPLHVRKDGAVHRVSAVAPGYEPVEVPFTADGNRHLILTLRPAKLR
jgi:hypothetical protein